jgi:DNA-directed RNA polymerase subunit K/omega
MSDIEDYESEYNSDSESSEDEKPIDKNNKNISKKQLNIDDILGKDYDSDSQDDENDDETIEEQNDDEIQYGGAEIDEISDDEIEEDYDEEEEQKEQKNKKNKKQQKNIPLIIEEDSDNESDEDNDEFDENYLQKFDRDINKNYVEEFHPECIIQNYDEVALLTRVVRDEQNIIIDPLHKTIPFLTKYEKARIIGQRAKQIESGAKPFIKVPENIIDSYIIAELELQQKVIPFIIKRPLPGGKCEYWNLKDLEIISF